MKECDFLTRIKIAEAKGVRTFYKTAKGNYQVYLGGQPQNGSTFCGLATPGNPATLDWAGVP